MPLHLLDAFSPLWPLTASTDTRRTSALSLEWGIRIVWAQEISTWSHAGNCLPEIQGSSQRLSGDFPDHKQFLQSFQNQYIWVTCLGTAQISTQVGNSFACHSLTGWPTSSLCQEGFREGCLLIWRAHRPSGTNPRRGRKSANLRFHKMGYFCRKSNWEVLSQLHHQPKRENNSGMRKRLKENLLVQSCLLTTVFLFSPYHHLH